MMYRSLHAAVIVASLIICIVAAFRGAAYAATVIAFAVISLERPGIVASASPSDTLPYQP
jgi:hypothetical protein